MSCVAIISARPSRASRSSSASQPIGARLVQAGERFVEEHHGRVLHERTRDEHALALAAGEVPERRVGVVAQPDGGERVAGTGTVATARAPPPRPSGDRAHERDVQRAHREVEPRALGLGHEPASCGGLHRAGERTQLTEQHPKQRRLAAAVGSEHRDALAGPQGERHVLEHGRTSVAGRDALGADAHTVFARRSGDRHSPLIAHPRWPSLKPRSIWSALASSIVR